MPNPETPLSYPLEQITIRFSQLDKEEEQQALEYDLWTKTHYELYHSGNSLLARFGKLETTNVAAGAGPNVFGARLEQKYIRVTPEITITADNTTIHTQLVDTFRSDPGYYVYHNGFMIRVTKDDKERLFHVAKDRARNWSGKPASTEDLREVWSFVSFLEEEYEKILVENKPPTEADPFFTPEEIERLRQEIMTQKDTRKKRSPRKKTQLKDPTTAI